MYENKFGNPEWEKAQDTAFTYYFVTNERAMIEEIYERKDHEMDEEAFNILLRKYYECHYTKYDLNKDTVGMEKEEHCLHQVYTLSIKKLCEFFDYSVDYRRDYDRFNEKRRKFAKEFIKFLEIRYLTIFWAADLLEKKTPKPSSYDDYGAYSKAIEKKVLRFLKLINNPIDYKKVKNGTYVYIPEDNEFVAQQETTKIQTNEKIDSTPKVSPKTRFWKDWSFIKKVLYVLLNLYTFCIPFIIHILLGFFKNKSDRNN